MRSRWRRSTHCDWQSPKSITSAREAPRGLGAASPFDSILQTPFAFSYYSPFGPYRRTTLFVPLHGHLWRLFFVLPLPVVLVLVTVSSFHFAFADDQLAVQCTIWWWRWRHQRSCEFPGLAAVNSERCLCLAQEDQITSVTHRVCML